MRRRDFLKGLAVAGVVAPLAKFDELGIPPHPVQQIHPEPPTPELQPHPDLYTLDLSKAHSVSLHAEPERLYSTELDRIEMPAMYQTVEASLYADPEILNLIHSEFLNSRVVHAYLKREYPTGDSLVIIDRKAWIESAALSITGMDTDVLLDISLRLT